MNIKEELIGCMCDHFDSLNFTAETVIEYAPHFADCVLKPEVLRLLAPLILEFVELDEEKESTILSIYTAWERRYDTEKDCTIIDLIKALNKPQNFKVKENTK